MSEAAGRWVYVRPHEPEGPSQVYTLRLPADAVERLKSAAADRGEAPTALARAWLLDRLAAEEYLAAEERTSRAAEPAPPYVATTRTVDALAWVRDRLGDVEALCARHGVRSFGVFGSVVTGAFEPGRSDVDVCVRFDEAQPAEKAKRFVDLVEELERRIGIHVDVVDADAVGNPFLRRAMDASLVILHERGA